jgi:hypothetical protein
MEILSFGIDCVLRGQKSPDYAVRFSINLQPQAASPRIVNTFPRS